MPDKTVAQKLLIKEGKAVYFANPPQGYVQALGELPAGVTVQHEITSPVDIIQAFVADRQELEGLLPRLKVAFKPGGALWVTYHKGTSRVRTDINRDTINAYSKPWDWRALP